MKIQWDQIGDKKYELGVDHGVLFLQENDGTYPKGIPWNGLTNVTESPEGAEPNDIYADNIKYLSLLSKEDFGATIEAFYSPEEFDVCDGTAEIAPGVKIGQQDRKGFAFSYRSKIGNDVAGSDYGYEVHIVYGCKASPTEKSKATENESPEAPTLSWEVTTTPIPMPGNAKPASHLWVSTLGKGVTKEMMTQLEDLLYGTDAVAADVEHNIEAHEATDPICPTPQQIVDIFGTINQNNAG
jgi:hypothetical protein